MGSLVQKYNWLVRLIRFAKSHGKSRAAYRFVERLIESRFFRKWCSFSAVEVFSASVSDLKATQKRAHHAFTVRAATEQDISAVQSFYGNRRRIKERMERGDICIITLCKDQIGAAVWLSPGPKYYYEDWDNLRCIVHYPVSVCWSYDGIGTRFGAWGSLMVRLPGFLEQFGIDEVYTHITCDNRISLDSHKSLGYRSAGFIWTFGIFRFILRLYRVAGGHWLRFPCLIGKLEYTNKQLN